MVGIQREASEFLKRSAIHCAKELKYTVGQKDSTVLVVYFNSFALSFLNYTGNNKNYLHNLDTIWK